MLRSTEGADEDGAPTPWLQLGRELLQDPFVERQPQELGAHAFGVEAGDERGETRDEEVERPQPVT